jgi:TolB-like protein/DNA-binding winged helix-turn-helix (wHTH) protein/Tfp pilus assembly protein PilF
VALLADLPKSEELMLDLGRYELRRDGSVLRLEKIPMELLILLVEKKDQMVGREEIIGRLWGKEVFLDTEQGVNTAVRKIRLALHDDPERPRYLQTVVGKGYRFIGPITIASNGSKAIETQSEPQSLSSEPVNPPTAPSTRRSGFQIALIVAAILVIPAVLIFLTNLFGLRHRLLNRNLQIRSIAVLPMENLSGDPAQDYFADGMTQALITELGKISNLRVISRQSVQQYKGSKKPLEKIAGELGVDAVLEGAVERSGDRVRVTVRVDRVSPESQVWANEYNRGIRDVLELEDEIARAVTGEIQVKLTPEERTRLASTRSVDPEAHDDYLRGRYQYTQLVAHQASRSVDPVAHEDYAQLAIWDFKQAIEKDPAYALAYAGLADAYIALGNPDWGVNPPKETLPEAKAAAAKALELDPSLGEAHFSLAQIIELYDWNWSEAEKEYRAALTLSPNYAEAHLEYGRFLQAMGRNDEAMTQMKYAIELDPFNIKTRVTVGFVTYASRQYDLAIKQFESLGHDFGLGWVYREKKMYPEAIAALQRSVSKSRRGSVPVASLAGVYGLAGRKGEARKLIDELKERARQRYVSGFLIAEAYGGLGEKDQAFTWLERAYEDHDQWMVFINAYPGLDPLRSEPRFQALVRRMNIPP